MPIRPPDPARPALRASDMDRERAATMLRESYSDGRLTLDEFQQRLEHAYAARTLGELDTLTADLPAPTGPTTQPITPPAVNRWSSGVRDRVLTYVVLMLFFIAIWAASGRHGSFWPIWPIVIGAFILAMSVLGSDRRESRRHARRVERSHRRSGRSRSSQEDEE